MAAGPMHARAVSSIALTLALGGCTQDPATPATETGTEASTSGTSTGTATDPTSAGSTDATLATTAGTETTTTTGVTEPGCKDDAPMCVDPVCEDGAWACTCDVASPEAGFIELEPIAYELGLGDDATPLESSPARLFYSFFPADNLPCQKPLFVLFNGGPGVTSALLLTMGTSPRSLDLGGALVDNPASWTTLGNLLYVDSRTAGFSYGLMDDPSDDAAREAEFGLANFNPYIDGADIARVVLRFLAAHPTLQRAPVITVGESYGGTRAGVLMNLLLLHEEYGDGSRRFRDPALVAEIEEHLATVFPEADSFPPEQVAQQFGRQVLIQPLINGSYQFITAGNLLDVEGSPIWSLADELDLTFVPCSEQGPGCNEYTNAMQFVEVSAHRSRYDTAASVTWFYDLVDRTRDAAYDHATLGELLATDPGAIPALGAGARAGAYHVEDPFDHPADEDVGDLPEHLGALAGGWDRYFIPFNSAAGIVFDSYEARLLDVDLRDTHYGVLFLENALHVDTLITAATRDVAIYAPSIPPALTLHDELVSAVTLDDSEPPDAVRPGEIVIDYTGVPLAGIERPGTRRVRFPEHDASHAVTFDQPDAMRDDIAEWLAPVPTL